MVTGAFETLVVFGFHIIANEMPLKLRREEQTPKHYYMMRAYLKNLSRTLTVTLSQETLFSNKRVSTLFSIRVNQIQTYMK